MSTDISFAVNGQTGASCCNGVARCAEALGLGTPQGEAVARDLAHSAFYGTLTPDHITLVAAMGMCAFGEGGPRKYKHFRYEYMRSVYDIFPDSYWLWWDSSQRTRVRFNGAASETADVDFGGFRGYAGIIPLTSTGYAEYLLGKRSQFEFVPTPTGNWREPAICTPQLVQEGRMAAIYIQALFDLRRFPFRSGQASLKVRGFDDFADSSLSPSSELNPDIVVGRDGKVLTKAAEINSLYKQGHQNEKARARLMCRRLHGLFPKPTKGRSSKDDPFRWAKRAPVICFEATTADGERFARQSYSFWRPMAISKDGYRIFGFNFAELEHASRMNAQNVEDALAFCTEVLAEQ